MSCQSRADNVHGEAQNNKSRFYFFVPVAIAAMISMTAGCATGPSQKDMADIVKEQVDSQKQEPVDAQHADTGGSNIEASEETGSYTPLPAGGEPASLPTFPTFDSTGKEICKNDEGLPLIYLFSSSQCSHCKWGGGAYDFIVRFLAADGLIEAHHYDLLSGDDLLTEEIESKIPADKMELYTNGNPKDLVPYYNFGCVYDRIGNGYEKENDLVAEGEEMRRVIEALVQMASEGGGD